MWRIRHLYLLLAFTVYIRRLYLLLIFAAYISYLYSPLTFITCTNDTRCLQWALHEFLFQGEVKFLTGGKRNTLLVIFFASPRALSKMQAHGMHARKVWWRLFFACIKSTCIKLKLTWWNSKTNGIVRMKEADTFTWARSEGQICHAAGKHKLKVSKRVSNLVRLAQSNN